jgi:hypothetical protein
VVRAAITAQRLTPFDMTCSGLVSEMQACCFKIAISGQPHVDPDVSICRPGPQPAAQSQAVTQRLYDRSSG